MPRYDELLGAVREVVRHDTPSSLVELGCGVGGLAGLLLQDLPGARLTALDASPSMAARARSALVAFGDRVEVVCADALAYAPALPVDAVVSTLVLHNLPPDARTALVARIARWLGPGGLFVWGEFLRMEDPAVQEATVAYRKRFTAGAGCPEDLAAWNYRKEAEEDFPPTATEVLALGRQAFGTGDVVWAHDAFGVFAFRR